MRTLLTFNHDSMQADIELKNIESRVGEKNYTVHTDYPQSMGGAEAYPTPWGLFLTALTACQGMNVHEYCAANGIDPSDITLSLDLQYAKTKPGEKPREVASFDICITVPETFPAEHLDSLKQAARNCKIVQHMLDYQPAFHYTVKK